MTSKPCPGVDGAIAYARDVVAGRVVAGSLARLACERFLRDLAEAQAGRGAWDFRPELAERPLRFAGAMPNIKGKEAGKPLRVLPWQQFVFANIFGFVERGSDIRRFRQGIVYVPRGNGKTTIAAPIALYLSFVEGEGGAEGYAAAVTRSQAHLLWDTAKQMVKRSPEFRAKYGVDVGAHAITQPASASRFVAVASDAKALDGLNVAAAVCDEIASHRTSAVYDLLLTAMGKRKHPFLLSISTATGNATGIGKTLWDYAARILEGKATDDRVFCLIYAADEQDDPWSEATWIKANPSWGAAVQPDAIRAIMAQARNNPAQEAAVRTRHLNQWAGADEALVSLRSWRLNARPTMRLEDFEGRPAYLGLDLASRSDLAGLSIVIPDDTDDGKRMWRAFARCYINEAAVAEGRHVAYPAWARDGHLVVTPGNETDFSAIEGDILDLCARFDVRAVAYDPWQATHLAQRLGAEGVPVVEFRATTQNFSEPTKELDASVRAGRLLHTGSPVLEWNIGNLVGHYDARGNVYPRKPRPEAKIDAAIALIMSLGKATADDAGTGTMGDFLAAPLSISF